MPDIPRPRPKLMIIGDSLAQGCRSLTVKASYCAQSWAARVARSQGWEFVTPDYPRPILYDLEDEVRRLDTLTLTAADLRFQHIGDRVRANLRGWLANARESQSACFDNLGLSGAAIHDLYTRSASSSAAEIAALTPQGASSEFPLRRIGDLHLAINGRFTLNPSQEPAFDSFTPLDWVRERRPETLAIQVGHNHGLYSIGSEAKDVPFDQGDAVRGGYFDQWERLAGDLARLPAEVGTILVVLLPKVGAVANLRPRGVERRRGYAELYEPVLSGSPAILAGTRLAEIDEGIRAANDRIRAILLGAEAAAGAPPRLRFLDTFALFDARDFKNSLQARRRIAVDSGIAVDNRYLDGALQLPPPFGPGGFRLVGGGYQSIDGMHPSGCGYADLASEAMGVLGLAHDRPALLRRAFADDILLSRYPGELEVLVRLLSVLRDLQRLNHLVVDRKNFLDDQMHIRDALQLMRSVFTRLG